MAEWMIGSCEEDLYKKGYFANLKPQDNVVNAARYLIDQGFDVYVLSSYLTDSDYALEEKKKWLNEHAPFIPEENRLFVPYGHCKNDYVPNGIKKDDVLMDDHTPNLINWAGIPVKVQNPVNCKNGTRHEYVFHYMETPALVLEKLKKELLKKSGQR